MNEEDIVRIAASKVDQVINNIDTKLVAALLETIAVQKHMTVERATAAAVGFMFEITMHALDTKGMHNEDKSLEMMIFAVQSTLSMLAFQQLINNAAEKRFDLR